MPAAARASDMTDHGTPLTPALGSPNVWIGGLRAWRAIMDVHICPQFDGPKAHAGGMVVKGSGKVFINYLPAARLGDEIAEFGRPNKITGGFDKVKIAD
jgi:uncharacterized Zn-binding protein involved in type VI secretion